MYYNDIEPDNYCRMCGGDGDLPCYAIDPSRASISVREQEVFTKVLDRRKKHPEEKFNSFECIRCHGTGRKSLQALLHWKWTSLYEKYRVFVRPNVFGASYSPQSTVGNERIDPNNRESDGRRGSLVRRLHHRMYDVI